MTLLSGGECLLVRPGRPAPIAAFDKGNPIVIAQPTDGVVVMVFPSAIPAGAPHPNAARLFMEWLLSRDFSAMIAIDGSEPIYVDVPAGADEPSLDGLQRCGADGGRNPQGRAGGHRLRRDLFGG